jgi:hypothetical protein
LVAKLTFASTTPLIALRVDSIDAAHEAQDIPLISKVVFVKIFPVFEFIEAILKKRVESVSTPLLESYS